MKFDFFSVLKYTVSLVVAGGLFWFLYRDQDMGKMIDNFSSIDYKWILLSMVLMLISHLSRAWRWSIMLRPLGYEVGIWKPFVAILVGYLANLVVPRMGEVSRCAVLKRTNDIPMNLSFGAVITERIVDVLMLLTITIMTVLLEFDKIGDFLINTFSSNTQSYTQKLIFLFGIFVLGVVAVVLLFLFKEKLAQFAIYHKIRGFVVGLKDGVLSVLQLKGNDRWIFVFNTVAIWVLYYFTSYVLFFCLPETSNLGMMCGLSILVMTAISIAAPVQGGTGIYHIFVAATLLAYGVNQDLGKYFALVMHSSQMLMIIFAGLIALVVLFFISPKNPSVHSIPQNDTKQNIPA